jgi:hypothetical protein
MVLLGVLSAIVLLPIGAVLWMTSVPGRSFEGPLPPLTPAQADSASRLREHVTAIASAPHNVARPKELERSALAIERALAGLGYKVARQPFRADGVEVRNMEAVIEPADPNAATLVIGAHYDSCCDAPGANDNGSGVAAVLELARMLSDLRGKSRMRIRLVLFVNEEPPYFRTEQMGSLVYARRLAGSGEKVAGMFSLETIGYYRDEPGSQRYPAPLNLLYPNTGNFVAFVGLTSSRSLVRKTVASFRAVAAFPSVGGTAPGAIPGIDWSDHWAFEQVGIPALMVTDTALFRYPHYHTPEDSPDKLDYERLARVTAGLEQVIRNWR